MRTVGLLLSGAVLLAACGDPLAGVPRISDVELTENDPTAAALPTEAEIAREGFFGTDTVRAADAPPLAAQPLITPEPERPRGFLGLLRRVLPEPVPAEQPAAEALPIDGQTDPLTLSTTAEIAPEQPLEAATAENNVELASLSTVPEALPAPEPQRRGFFGRLTQPNPTAPKARTGVDTMDVEYGTVLPYGVVARTCASKRQPLGRKVESASASGYKLYDSNPRATGPRTFYITGFDDGCPRQLTAAHVLFGAPSFYELLHYGPTGQHLKFGSTDKAYEKVKNRVCGVRKGKPCGAKIDRLERDTFFVNSYERADDNTRWSELLVHDSVVIASALKTN